MNDKRFPDTIMGLYEIDLEKQILYPVALPKHASEYYRLRKITLLGGIGLARFENDLCIPLVVEYNHYVNQYSFIYNHQEHLFEIKACLNGLIDLVEVLDFSQGALWV